MSSPKAGPSEPELSAVITFYGGYEINVLIASPIEAKTEDVPAHAIGRGDVVNVPGSDAWGTVARILDGETGGTQGVSASRFFTAIGIASNELQFNSYYRTPDQSGRVENDVVTRLSRE